MARRWIAATLVGTVVAAHSLAAAELTAPHHSEYRIAWNGIPAAWATIDVIPQQSPAEPGYAITAQAATNTFVDLFWRFRGNARSTVLADQMVPLSFTYERRINSTPELTWIDFHQGAGGAQGVHIKRERRKELHIDAPDIVDPITAAFRALNSDVRIGDELGYRIFTGQSHYRVVLSVRGEDTIDVPAGRFEALRVEPQITQIKDEQRRPDKRVQRAMIWVTRTPVRTILRIRSEITVGAVTLDLVRLERQPPSSPPAKLPALALDSPAR